MIFIIAQRIAFSHGTSKSLKQISSLTTLEKDINVIPPLNDQHHDAIYKPDNILHNDPQNNLSRLQNDAVHQYNQFL